MALINHRAHEIQFKIVYYGPSLGGKTTNLKVLHGRLPDDRRGRLLSIATDHERTLFFDFMPIELGAINGLTTRFHLYTVPGQAYYRLSRRAVLQGLDALVFVADSHPARESANLESMNDLREQLATLGLTPSQVERLPRAIQYNKRDVAGALPIERMRAALNPDGLPEFEAVASEGRGVSETLRAVLKGVLQRLVETPAASDATHSSDPGRDSRAATTSAVPPTREPAPQRRDHTSRTFRAADARASARR
jgi:mutual gliding-motility protein MglA